MPICDRCLNTSMKYFAMVDGQWVCRRCIAYQGEDAKIISVEASVDYELPFQLTPAQQRIAESAKALVSSQDVLLKAVCGAGKTELVMEAIRETLNQNGKVGIAVARRQVALQLVERFRKAFAGLKVIVVCEGHTEDLQGHLIVTTTHQLYRFRKTFDLLVLDEPDAFPYRNDPVLHGFMTQAVKGHILYLTATPDKDLMKRVRQKRMALLSLNVRPHGYPLPIPELIFSPYWVQVILLGRLIHRSEKRWLIFVPSVALGQQVSRLLKIPFVHAQSEDLDQRIDTFKTKRIKALIATTVLERGVTFSDIQVAVLCADHPVFDHAAFIQIAGRAGRDPQYPIGEVKCFCLKPSNALRITRNDLRKANRSVRSVSRTRVKA